jgi:hypothetical protein
MDPRRENELMLTRRQFFGRSACGIGTGALAALLSKSGFASTSAPLNSPHFTPKAKRVIYLFMSGGPSQLDLFDYKPNLTQLHGTELPPSVRGTQRLTGMTSDQKTFPVVSSKFRFNRYGKAGIHMSETLPHIGSIADDICLVRSLNTEAINHDPATTYIVTGFQQPGKPGMGAWLSYGLGNENENLPAFTVLISRGNPQVNAQPLYPRLWSAAFLPSEHQGVVFRSGSDPVLFLSNPPGVTHASRRRMLDGLAHLNQIQSDQSLDPEIAGRIAQYEMAYRMQTSVPELTDISDEPEHILALYGDDVRKPGSFAFNCLMARRMAERGVRFVQLYHRGWDQHENLPRDIGSQCKDTDQPSAGLVKDLKQRGMLDDTLVVWGGEFGRTSYSQGALKTDGNYGRDHHGRCFSIWMAGGGIKAGVEYGKTDDFSYNVVEQPVHVHDFNATILNQLGFDHQRLTFRYQGRDFRLTDVFGNVVGDIVA